MTLRSLRMAPKRSKNGELPRGDPQADIRFHSGCAPEKAPSPAGAAAARIAAAAAPFGGSDQDFVSTPQADAWGCMPERLQRSRQPDDVGLSMRGLLRRRTAGT